MLKVTEPQESIYSPLACELCTKMFTIPAEWVRHIESHAETVHCVPKKRKRIEVNQNNVNIERRTIGLTLSTNVLHTWK